MSTSKTRLLVIGAGSIGERHARCFQKTGRAEVTLCDTNAALLKDVADRYGLSNAWGDLDEALAAEHDAALVATPAPTHIPLARKCADAGLHVLIEKPLTLKLDGVAALQQTLADRGRIGAVAFVQRANPLYNTLHAHLSSGRWGKPLQLTINAGQHFPTFRPAYREIYYTKRESGGGAILDAMSHMLNLGEWLAGPINKVLADADHLALPGVSVEDTVHVITRQGDTMASYTLNQHQHPNETYVQLVCEGGTVRTESHTNRITWMQTPCGEPQEQRLDIPDRDTAFIAQANNFLDAIAGRAEPLCSLAEGLQTQRVLDQVLDLTAAPPWRTIAPTA